MAKKKSTNKLDGLTAANPIADSITVLVHGTFSRETGRWHRPGSRFHQYIRQSYFPDVYSGTDFYFWSGDATNTARLEAAHKLVKWCQSHPAKTYNFISHSHGTNVVNLATNNGLSNVGKLIHMSPPVWPDKPDYLPDMSVVDPKLIYNFHPRFDWIVTVLARANQNFDGSTVDCYEDEFELRGADHWAPVRVYNWRRYNIGDIVTNDQLRG